MRAWNTLRYNQIKMFVWSSLFKPLCFCFSDLALCVFHNLSGLQRYHKIDGRGRQTNIRSSHQNADRRILLAPFVTCVCVYASGQLLWMAFLLASTFKVESPSQQGWKVAQIWSISVLLNATLFNFSSSPELSHSKWPSQANLWLLKCIHKPDCFLLLIIGAGIFFLVLTHKTDKSLNEKTKHFEGKWKKLKWKCYHLFTVT